MSYEDKVAIAFFIASLSDEEATIIAKFHKLNDDE